MYNIKVMNEYEGEYAEIYDVTRIEVEYDEVLHDGMLFVLIYTKSDNVFPAYVSALEFTKITLL